MATESKKNPWKQGGELGEGYSLLTMALDQTEDASTGLKIEALNRAATLAQQRGDFGAAVSLAGSALELLDQSDDPARRLLVLENTAALATDAGDYALAERHPAASLELARELEDEIEIARASYNLGLVAQRQVHPQQALPLIATAYEIAERLGNVPGQCFCLNTLGRIRREGGEPLPACELLGKALVLVAQTGHDLLAASSLEELATCALELGDFDTGARLMVTALDLRERHGSVSTPGDMALTGETKVALEQASDSAAAILHGSSPLPLSECVELGRQLLVRSPASEIGPQLLAATEHWHLPPQG